MCKVAALVYLPYMTVAEVTVLKRNVTNPYHLQTLYKHQDPPPPLIYKRKKASLPAPWPSYLRFMQTRQIYQEADSTEHVDL